MFGVLKILPLIALLAGIAYITHVSIVNDLNDQIRDLTVTNQNLSQRVSVQDSKILEQNQAISSMQENLKHQQDTIHILQQENNEITVERDQYLSIFKRHDMVKLSLAMPGMMENRINNGTKQLFITLTKDTTEEINNEQATDTDTASNSD